MSGTFTPIYALLTGTAIALVAALVILSLRNLLRRRVQCPVQGAHADIVVEEHRKTPWDRNPQLDVVRCSLMQGDAVTCAKGCLGCHTVDA
ncbi:MAG: hypothetical protein FJ100_04310 [Deltaproteobacteria bacterium]|nr:hypothetical protein [Deltaproteobacteria bacterium]